MQTSLDVLIGKIWNQAIQQNLSVPLIQTQPGWNSFECEGMPEPLVWGSIFCFSNQSH